MKIESSLLQPGPDIHLGALATVADGRSYFVGIGLLEQGPGDKPGLTCAANSCFEVVSQHAQHHGSAIARTVLITRINEARDRVRTAFAHGEEREVLFFVCSFPAIYDAVWAELNVRLPARRRT